MFLSRRHQAGAPRSSPTFPSLTAFGGHQVKGLGPNHAAAGGSQGLALRGFKGPFRSPPQRAPNAPGSWSPLPNGEGVWKRGPEGPPPPKLSFLGAQVQGTSTGAARCSVLVWTFHSGWDLHLISGKHPSPTLSISRTIPAKPAPHGTRTPKGSRNQRDHGIGKHNQRALC